MVDIWGGVADKATGRTWDDRTLQFVFSTTKRAAAVCVARRDAYRVGRGVGGPDTALVAETRFGMAFMLDNETVPLLGPNAFGHAGAGGSLGQADPDSGVGYGYLMNQMLGGIASDPRTVRLNDAVRACL